MFLLHHMKTIEVPFLEFDTDFPSMGTVSERLSHLEKNKIDQLNWERFDYKPDTVFSIGFTGHEIMLRYWIEEDFFKAEKTESNQNVFEDSCVEFFIAPADDGIYYNLEINAIGTCLLGSGKSRADRIRADRRIIEPIRRISSEGNVPVPETTGKKSWNITLAIPFKVFFRHQINTLKGMRCRANFYKCGDKLARPHYLTWSPVKTEKPDFHRPEFFGSLWFA